MTNASRWASRIGVGSLLLGVVALGSLAGCSGGGSAGASATLRIGVIEIGSSTVFRATVDAVDGVSGASTFAVLGADSPTLVSFGAQSENYTVDEATTVLAIYDGGGTMLAQGTLDAVVHGPSYDGSLSLSTALSTTGPMPVRGVRMLPASTRVLTPQLDTNLNVMATGLIENVDVRGTFLNVEVPLFCGGTVGGGGTFDPSLGFFLINDVLIEFNYAFDDPQAFQHVLNVEFIASGRDFDAMGLYFKLPGAGRNVIDARTGAAVSSSVASGLLAGVSTTVSATSPYDTATAWVNLEIVPFGPSNLATATVTSVDGACVVGANSFYVLEADETPDPDAIKAIGDGFDVPTQEDTLVLLILGDEVDQRDQELSVCDQWSAVNSGGFGTTVDSWNISAIPAGATFDIRFNAYSIPDRFIVEYPPGSTVLNTGWRGDSSYDGNPTYPGGIAGPGSGEVQDIFLRGATSSIRVTVNGPDANTAWQYSLRCRTP